jgi:hypothetical protein
MRLPGKLVRGSVRPDRASLARFVSLRWAALPIIDRRWTAPMSAAALGFGLFVGVAIGPATQGTQGASEPMVVQVPPTTPEIGAPAEPPDGAGGSGGGGQDPGAGSPAVGGSPPPSTPPPIDVSSSPPTTSPTTTPPISPPVTTTTPPVTTTPETTTTTTTTDEESTTSLAGTVVHLNPEAHSYTIADGGSMKAIHSHRPPNLGVSIEVEAKRLANGTYSEAGNRTEHGRNAGASVDGTVSFSDPRTRVYTVSAPGVSLLVRGAGQKLPDLGDRVEVRVRIADDAEPLPVRPAGEQGCGRPPALPKPPTAGLEQVRLQIAGGEPAASVDVEGIVQGVCKDAGRLIVSADDVRESGRDIELLAPKKIELGKLDTGDVLRVTTEILDGGSLQLSSVAGDGSGPDADDPDLVQALTQALESISP